MKKYASILFDLDGTLFDTWPQIRTTLDEIALEIGWRTPLLEISPQLSFHSRREMLEIYFDRVITDEIELLFIDKYKSNIHNTLPFEGIELVHKALADKKVPWAIVTNKPAMYLALLQQFHPFLGCSSSTICADHVHAPKPNPQGLIDSCRHLGLDVSQTVFIGDGVSDWQAAQACGMDFALARYGYVNFNPAQANIVHQLERPIDILKLIDQAV